MELNPGGESQPKELFAGSVSRDNECTRVLGPNVLDSPRGRLTAGKAANRRAPRVFEAVPESDTMSANPTDGGTSPPKSGGRPPKSWAGRSRMKLVGALRGKGALLVAERTVPASYEMDVFDLGA